MTTGGLSEQEYDAFRRILESASGIVLGDNKHYLVASRLNRLVQESGFTDLGGLIKELEKAANSKLKERVVDAMTTNETMWFRDKYPFEMLTREILPELGKARKNPIRVWSAACSSGQETYSISMTVNEFIRSNPGKLAGTVEITATDISPTMLGIAKDGVYEELVVTRGLSEERQTRFFRKQADNRWAILPELKKNIRFTELNLLGSYGLLGRFDVVFMRNVLIYFSAESKKDILERVAQSMNPGAYLFLGGSESPTGYTNAFEMQRLTTGVVYRLRADWKP